MAISSRLAQPRSFASWLRLLFRHDWVVYAKRPFGGPEHALRYLGNYTHRVAISNHRLVALTDGGVTFRWRDSAHGNKKRLMTLPVDEFLRRFLLHLLPRGFVRIRNFGFLANRQRAQLLPLCFSLLRASEVISATSASPAADRPHSSWNCPRVRRNDACHRTALRSSTLAPFPAIRRARRMKAQLHPRALLVSAHAHSPASYAAQTTSPAILQPAPGRSEQRSAGAPCRNIDIRNS